ncbi:MAG TPA: Crp/Fnr family transcriptional regulator [Syntrophomonadaceae bacterium]|nr:Crp/Fnr family transcriptional regulator [Syntrophomonadaceae bacterium]
MKNIKYFPDIKNNELFKSLSENEFLEVINYSRISTYLKKSIIHLQNEPCSSIGIILEGDVVIQRLDENGKVLTIVTLEVGESFGGNLIFSDQGLYPMTVSANSDSTILHVGKETIIDLCQKNKDFLIEFMRSISNKTIIVSNKLNAITMKSIREQIIDSLIQEYKVQQSLHLELPLNRKNWAESLGIPRPSLSRELSKMKADKLIDYAGNWILIIDESILENS